MTIGQNQGHVTVKKEFSVSDSMSHFNISTRGIEDDYWLTTGYAFQNKNGFFVEHIIENALLEVKVSWRMKNLLVAQHKIEKALDIKRDNRGYAVKQDKWKVSILKKLDRQIKLLFEKEGVEYCKNPSWR